MINPWQRKVAETYGEGDCRHVHDLDECRNVMDGLFTFLMIELDRKEGCDSWEEAARRVDAAIIQLEEVANALLRRP